MESRATRGAPGPTLAMSQTLAKRSVHRSRGGGWQIAGTGDFTGTGEDSILWRNSGGDTLLWNPNGSGGFVGEDLGVVPTNWQIVETGDFNGSGQSGILWRDSSGDTELWNPNGSGGFVGESLGAVPTSWSVQKIFA